MLAFAIAPLAAPVAIAVIFTGATILQIGWFRGKGLQAVLPAIFLYGSWSCALAYPAAVLLGIPAYAIAQRRGWLSLRQAIVIGGVVALLPIVFVFGWMVVQEPRLAISTTGEGTLWLLLFAACGASCGAVFWSIALRQRSAV